ncbi:MAG: SAM-dependent methyltransferase [Rectinemataceae bacterium]|jgi:16S rRNA (cytidine1402-2'-O)-methyltransferase
MSQRRGVLYLVPNLLDPSSLPEATLPAAALERVRSIRRFVVEGEKAAWRLLSRLLLPEAVALVSMERLDEHTAPEALPGLLSPLEAGEDIGLISEAGMPCIADPGSALAALAHDRGFTVVPLVGPSSIILALAASGLDGQRFSFLGYLPKEPRGRKAALASMERGIRSDGATRIFIETPYRNARLLEDCIAVLSAGTRLCVAASLCSPSQRIRSSPIASWRAVPWALGKEPAIFLAGLSTPRLHGRDKE